MADVKKQEQSDLVAEAVLCARYLTDALQEAHGAGIELEVVVAQSHVIRVRRKDAERKV